MDEIIIAVNSAIGKWLEEFEEFNDGDEFVTVFNNCVLVVSNVNGEFEIHFIGGKPYEIDMTLQFYERW